MERVRIRGIYSTALTAILKEEFAITQPSEPIRERFKDLEFSEESPDVDIFDKKDKQGVIARGKPEAVYKVKTILEERLPDLIYREEPVQHNGIYKGVVRAIDERRRIAYVDIGVLGTLPIEGEPPELGSEIIVQVKEAGRRPRLTDSITIGGENVVLIPSKSVKISRRIRDPRKREELLELGTRLLQKIPGEWGILFRTSSASLGQEEIEEEVEKLLSEANEIVSSKQAAPALLRAGELEMTFEFPGGSKRVLDEVRSKVCCTIAGHHKLKADRPEVASMVELAERLLEQNPSMEAEIVGKLKQAVASLSFNVGDLVSIEHVRPSGRVIRLGPGVVEDLDEGYVLLKRGLRPGGFLDGLGVRKEEGDYAITEIREGEWFIKTSYYDRRGELKGEYYNVNTPVEIYTNRVRYIDLIVDVVRKPDGSTEIIDIDKAKRARESGIISERIYQRAIEVAEEIKRRLLGEEI